MEAFREKFQTEKLLIQKVGSWVISLRPKQITLGSLVLSLDRECPHLGEMTAKEGEELSAAFKAVEDLLEKAFQADKINYLALMMVDHQVHFHVVPRYENPQAFQGKTFEDKTWPKPPVVSDTYVLEESELLEIRDYMKM